MTLALKKLSLGWGCRQVTIRVQYGRCSNIGEQGRGFTIIKDLESQVQGSAAHALPLSYLPLHLLSLPCTGTEQVLEVKKYGRALKDPQWKTENVNKVK